MTGLVPESLDAYRSFNPAGWVSAYKLLPMWAGILFVILGVGMLLFGGGKFFRLVAGPLGAAIGYLWAPIVIGRLGMTVSSEAIAYAAAAFLGVMGFVFPPGLCFFAIGVPLGLIGGQIAGANDWAVGFAPAALIGGTIAAAAHRIIASVVSSILGAWLLVLGMLAALHQVGTLVAMVAQQPWGVIIAAILFAIAGSVYQIAVRPSPEEAEKISAEKALAKKRKEEKAELEKRWGKYVNK
ncbi:MAG: hypothetical protein ACJ790_12775 [Myxococcaceae bacterium]